MTSPAKFSKKIVAGHTGGQNGFHIMARKLTQGGLRYTYLQLRSKAAVAHARRIHRNQQKGKLILSLEVLADSYNKEHYQQQSSIYAFQSRSINLGPRLYPA